MALHYPELWSYGSHSTNGTELELRWLSNIGQPETGAGATGVVTLFHDTLQKGSSLSGEYQCILSGTRTPKSIAARPGSGALAFRPAS